MLIFFYLVKFRKIRVGIDEFLYFSPYDFRLVLLGCCTEDSPEPVAAESSEIISDGSGQKRLAILPPYLDVRFPVAP